MMNKKSQPFLSKTKYMSGLQCLKYLWYLYNRKKEIPAFGPETLEIFEQGRIVGELAHQLYPDGIKIERDWKPENMTKKSLLALQQGKPLFEAGFTFKQAYAIADILIPAKDGQWDLIEVKSSTSVKHENLHDAAFQKYTYQGAGIHPHTKDFGVGINIRKCYLMYINKEYVRQGEIDIKKYFKKEDISSEVDKLLPGIEAEMNSMLETIAADNPPEVKVGPHCDDPYECPLQDLCWKFLPQDHIFLLRGKSKTAFDLMEQGILKITDIPRDFDLNEKQAIQVQCHRSKNAHIDKGAIKSFIKELKYPLYFLDFETINPAIPFYDLSRPYEVIPFQFSLHVVEKEGEKPIHHAYLATGEADPRQEILKQLKELLGSSGSIVAYNAGYEINCLKSMVRAYPEYEEWFEDLSLRFVDLWGPFRNLFYYHPAQEGSASMKDVLPALTGITYDDMEIGEGGAASREYLRVTFGKNIEEKDRLRVREALLKYCELDTRAMIEILGALGV